MVHGRKLCHGTTPVPPALHELEFEFGPPGTVTTTKSFSPMLTLVKTEKELYTITKRERKEGLYAHVPKFKADIKEI